MASKANNWDMSATLDAARRWIDSCLIEDRSVFGPKQLWVPTLVQEVKRAFVDNPNEGEGDFWSKLKSQMATASALSQQLMAEMTWALFLFPSNVRAETKRRHVREAWALSGEQLDEGLPLLQDAVLRGIGSGGQGFLNHMWRETAYMIELAGNIKQLDVPSRRQIFSDYDAYINWIDAVPQEGNRQLRHMLRFLAFPERVERMSSNTDRHAILAAFHVAPVKEIRKWSDRQLDEGMLLLRQRLEGENPGLVLDFYEKPLNERWTRDGTSTGSSGNDEIEAEDLDEGTDDASDGPRNLILYGPPGTGKTYWLRQKCAAYTDKPEAVDNETWLQNVLSNYGWRAVIAAALSDLGEAARVPQIRDHHWVLAKARQRGRSVASVGSTLWSYLQAHTPEDTATVKYAARHPPFIFTKQEAGDWKLLPEWQDEDEESAELWRLLKAGPSGAREPVRRYRVVTFHPSFSYEDFVRGIRPVVITEDGSTQFRMVDGVFKQICDEARANPSKRYALFIDEINRANIAKVFGELITLIEPDKRATFDAEGRVTGGMVLQLAGGGDSEVAEPPFGVPSNLDIYGTMNTADRSIALLDVALRRRFEFMEMEPKYPVIDKLVGTVHLGELLRRLNDRLEYLLDRDHRIGHAYFVNVKSLQDLRRAFSVQIIPLVQEFFFDDLSRVAMILATDSAAAPFTSRERLDRTDLFPGAPSERLPEARTRFRITDPATWTEESFKGVYASSGDESDPHETE
jgi:5-methylcytosine-specific restriction enzyme B